MASATGSKRKMFSHFKWDDSMRIPRFFCSHWTTHKNVPGEYAIYTITSSTVCYRDPWGIIHFVGGRNA